LLYLLGNKLKRRAR